MLHSSHGGTSGAEAHSNYAEKHRQVLEERIREKIADYAYYKFTVRQTRALNIFFDLAQEYEDILYLYHLPVQVLQFFFNLKAELYARNDSGEFVVQTPKVGPDTMLPSLQELSLGPRPSISISSDTPESPQTWWFFPVKGRPDGSQASRERTGREIPHSTKQSPCDERAILAILAILPQTALTGHEKLFFEKFTNRLGFCLHNRILALKNLEHIEFVRTLVHDIGHNVIVPNLHFKLLLRQMSEKMTALRQLSNSIADPNEEELTNLHALCDRIQEHYEEISKHFHQSSFFLETLLRQSHFDQGRYVLQRTTFNLVNRVVAPQLERYQLRFQDREIDVQEYYGDIPVPMVNGDIGLLSQVVANFFSNAVKYTRPTPGRPGLLMRCSVHAAPDFFGDHDDGIRVEVLSSGEAIPADEADQLFSENFRASNTENEHGTGHGLYFSRLIINQHGGECGCIRTAEGNVFYLVLPVHREE